MLATNLHGTAISRLCAATRGNFAKEPGSVVGPHGDLTPITAIDRVGVDGRATSDVRLRSVLLGAGAMEITADEHRAAAGIAGSVDARTVEQADVLAEDFDGAAGRACVGAGDGERAAVGDDA